MNQNWEVHTMLHTLKLDLTGLIWFELPTTNQIRSLLKMQMLSAKYYAGAMESHIAA